MADGELSAEAHKMFARELILVCGPNATDPGTLYAHKEFLAAFQAAILERLAASIPVGATARAATRALAAMRSPDVHKATLASALSRLKEHGHPVDPKTLEDDKRRVVAVFAANA